VKKKLFNWGRGSEARGGRGGGVENLTVSHPLQIPGHGSRGSVSKGPGGKKEILAPGFPRRKAMKKGFVMGSECKLGVFCRRSETESDRGIRDEGESPEIGLWHGKLNLEDEGRFLAEGWKFG